jgi:hypothetical protein
MRQENRIILRLHLINRIFVPYIHYSWIWRKFNYVLTAYFFPGKRGIYNLKADIKIGGGLYSPFTI